MANRESGACRVVFNLFVCFGPVLVKGFSELLFSTPCKTFQTPSCFSPLSFYYLICKKNWRGSPTSRRLGGQVSPQGCRCWAERTQTGSGEARQVLSIIQHVKREEGARKSGRVKAGSGVGERAWTELEEFPPPGCWREVFWTSAQTHAELKKQDKFWKNEWRERRGQEDRGDHGLWGGDGSYRDKGGLWGETATAVCVCMCLSMCVFFFIFFLLDVTNTRPL